MIALVPQVSVSALPLCIVLAGVAFFIISRIKEDTQFLMRLFVAALLIRIAVATFIYFFNLQSFFGTDAATYDFYGYIMIAISKGDLYYRAMLSTFLNSSGTAWGMVYIVAAVYSVIGRNSLAVQIVNSIIGAATAPVIFLCAHHIFNNLRVSRIAAVFVAFYPSLILWSAQGLKDGPIVLLLSLSMFAALRLREKFNVKFFLLLVFSLFSILSLRFYIFYILVAAIGGSYILSIGGQKGGNLVRQFLVLIGICLALTYLGIQRYASVQVGAFDLQTVQTRRAALSRGAESGYAEDTDVSTTAGALSALPLGITYLLFAPFPWQLASLRQSITLPEMLVWWASFPALVLGLWFTGINHLRRASPVLLFTGMLTLAYSIFQGNVGTAYRQRAQVLVFYFIFVAVGIVLLKERREERKRQLELEAQKESAAHQTKLTRGRGASPQPAVRPQTR